MKEQINIFQTVMGGWLFPVMWKVRLYGRIRKCGWNLYWSVGSRVGGALYRHHYIDASDTRWHRGDVSEGPNHCHCAHSVSCDIARISCMTCTYWLIDFSQHNDDVNLKVFSKFLGGLKYHESLRWKIQYCPVSWKAAMWEKKLNMNCIHF